MAGGLWPGSPHGSTAACPVAPTMARSVRIRRRMARDRRDRGCGGNRRSPRLTTCRPSGRRPPLRCRRRRTRRRSQSPTEPAPPATPTKNYVLPAVEIVGFSFLLNLYNRHLADDADDYKSTISTIRHNLHSSWVVDSDPFRTNQLGHPYLGSMYHGFARSAGLNYWEALGLYVRRQRPVGDRRRKDAAFPQRPDQYRRRRHVSRRGAVPHGARGACA